MTEALAKKKRIRAGHKASATKTIRHIEEVLTSDTPDKARLSLLRLTLKEKFDTIKALDGEIIDLIEDETLADEIEQADSYKETIFASLVRIEELMETSSTVPRELPGTSPADSRSEGHGSASRVKLPKLQLRPFGGELTKWTSFWDSFESAVHNNRELSDIEKFNYLTSLLERSAREAISGLSLTTANYQRAIETLKKRFGSKQQIINRHMDVLLHVEAVHSAHSTKALRRLFDNISSHVRSLQSLGVEPNSYGSLLCPVLLTKLPAELQLTISRKVTEADWNLDSLMRAVEEEIVARERIGVSTTNRTTSRREERVPPTATTLVSGNPTGMTSPCCYCNQLHNPTNCDSVTQIEARKQSLRKSGRCFSCLRRGHVVRDCCSTNRCRTCGGGHHTSICHKLNTTPRQTPPQLPSSDAKATPTVPNDRSTTAAAFNPSAPVFQSTPTSTSLYVDSSKAILLQTALVEAYNPDDPSLTVKLRVIMDSGSQRSYLTQRVKDTLALVANNSQSLSIAAFGSIRGDLKLCELVRIGIQLKSSCKQELELFVVPHICDPLTVRPINFSSRIYSHLTQLDLADTFHSEAPLEVDMLIGSDLYWDLVTGETVRGRCGPVAISTKLGWVLSGPAETVEGDKPTVSLTAHTLQVNTVGDEEPDAVLRSFWELECLGLQGPDDSVHDRFISSITLKEKRYEVSLPWRDYHEPLPDNYELSLRRLHGLLQRLRQTPAVLKEYDAIIRDQLSKGIVERVNPSLSDMPGKIHYLPHHAVVRQDKETTKVRVVYDASARSNGPSLNDCLYIGPKFNQKILEILLRFRSYPIAWTADIEKAFLMISMTPRDRDVLRFLWINDIESHDPEVVCLRFARVVFGVSSSPFLLNATLKHHIEKYSSSYPEIVRILKQSIYVDDVVAGADSEDEAYTLYTASKEILSHASFNLRKFVTNSPTLQDRVDTEEVQSKDGTNSQTEFTMVEALEETYVEATLPAEPCCRAGEQKVLGVRWNVHLDQLIFELSGIASIAMSLSPTKRNVISLIGRFYDPLGFLSPVTIRFKVFMQELCKSKLSWDQLLEGEALIKWCSIIDGLAMSQPITIPRCFLSGVEDDMKLYRLYGYCDASTVAYAAVIYLVEERGDSKYSRFIVSKTRVSPLKVQTTPRLELLSAVLLARMMTNVIGSLNARLSLEEPQCFTDSQVALYWIKGIRREWKPFVQHRVDEIRKLIPAECWEHCTGKSNPADIPSRGLTPSELAVNKLWRKGPEWLQVPINIFPLPEGIPEPCIEEMKVANRKDVHSLLTPTEIIDLSSIIDCERYATAQRLYRITAYVLKFISLLRKRARSPELTIEDKAEAERLWIVHCQSVLVKDKNFPMWEAQFSLFTDNNGILRCGGRLQNADLSFSSKHPILLYKKHYLTYLIVKNAHERVQHNGVKETLTEVRSKYWIIRGRSLVKSFIHKCIICRHFDGMPLRAPPAPPLPTFRVNEAPAFSNSAVDFAGPLYVRNGGVSKSNKVWICLFTCCVTRAVHLELVLDLSAVTFIRCLKRFAARRGLPQKIVSDNAKTFKATAKAIDSMLKDQDVQNYLSHVGVEWVFNLEKAPWWGGIFERLIKSTKRCLRKLIGQAKFSYDEMHTAIVEIECIINSRPLSYVSSDDTEEPLTPSHLLVGHRILNLPDNLSYFELDDADFEVTNVSVQRRAKHLNSVLNHFWKRWSKEYLLELRESHRHQHSTKSLSPIDVGDIVVVHDQDHPRGFWKLAKVEKLLTGKDNHVRGARLRLPLKNGHVTILQQPLQLLYSLEAAGRELPPLPNGKQDQNEDHVRVYKQNEPDSSSNVGDAQRPRRLSAKRARDQFKLWSSELLGSGDDDR